MIGWEGELTNRGLLIVVGRKGRSVGHGRENRGEDEGGFPKRGKENSMHKGEEVEPLRRILRDALLKYGGIGSG